MIFERSLPLCLVSPSAVMIRRSLLEEVGLFDETLPACEDYDLWLRITWKYPVHLIETPLIVKRGGHADQLSAMPELDKYRIAAIVKILKRGCLSPGQQAAALATLKEKCRIYALGCDKRGKTEEAGYYRRLPEEFGVRSSKFKVKHVSAGKEQRYDCLIRPTAPWNSRPVLRCEFWMPLNHICTKSPFRADTFQTGNGDSEL